MPRDARHAFRRTHQKALETSVVSTAQAMTSSAKETCASCAYGTRTKPVESILFRRHSCVHRELMVISGTIIDAARLATPQSLRELRSQRVRLGQVLREHILSQEQFLQDSNQDSNDVDLSELVLYFRKDLRDLRCALLQIDIRWPMKAVAQDPARFAVEYISFHFRLERRLEWEECTFYPVVFSGGRRSSDAPSEAKARDDSSDIR